VIVAIGGKKIESVNDLFLILEQHKVGDAVSIALVRDKRRQEVKVTLEELK